MDFIGSDYHIHTQTASSEVVNKLKTKLGLMRGRLPSDSYTDMKVELAPSGFWEIDLSIRFSRGHIGVHRFGSSLDHSVERVMYEVQDKLKLWYTQREVETFRLDKMSEFEYYSEIIDLLRVKSSGMKLLVVDDDPTALTVLTRVFGCLGCEVVACATPDEGIERLVGEDFDLVILDWNLPYKSGADFLREANSKIIQKEPMEGGRARVPVVICSSLPAQEIEIPDVESFRFLYPWHKAVPFSSIIATFEKTLKSLYFHRSADGAGGAHGDSLT